MNSHSIAAFVPETGVQGLRVMITHSLLKRKSTKTTNRNARLSI